jgi:hypothetical protein
MPINGQETPAFPAIKGPSKHTLNLSCIIRLPSRALLAPAARKFPLNSREFKEI